MRVGLLLNPYAGIGGPAGLKGSDGEITVETALARGVESRVAERVGQVLDLLSDLDIEFVVAPGEMGADLFKDREQTCSVIDIEIDTPSRPEDTRAVASRLKSQSLDVILFAGGDGTARDVYDALGEEQVVLGIPSGVKMHSGVFANNPASAASVVREMADGKLVTVMKGEVRDIDEESFRLDHVRTRFYGEMWVPEELRYLQQVKMGGKEVEALVLDDLAAWIVEHLEEDVTYFLGGGSTTAAVMTALGLQYTLLGVDVIRNGEVLISDAYEAQLFELVETGPCHLIVTAIGGQGHIFGRGNQQFSPRVIQGVGTANISVIATKSKLENLPAGLVVDTGDPELDRALAGFIRVTTGYDDSVLCPVRN